MLTAAFFEEQLNKYEEDLKDYRENLKLIRRRLGQRSPEEQQQWMLKEKEKSLARSVELFESTVKTTQKSMELLFPEDAERRRRSKAQTTQMCTGIDVVFSNVKSMWHTLCRSRRDGYTMLDDSDAFLKKHD